MFHKPLPWERVLTITTGLVRGLSVAHRSGVLHRDIKPANIMITDEGEAKILDFGLAKLLDVLPHSGDTPVGLPHALSVRARSMAHLRDVASAQTGVPPEALKAVPSLTSTGALLGTPLYMPPEIWRGERATPRSDIYSLGAVLYEICSGTTPAKGLTIQELFNASQQQDAPPLSQLAAGLDLRFTILVDRCLQRDPEARFASAEEFDLALSALFSQPSVRTSLGGPSASAEKRKDPRAWTLPAAGIVLLAAVLMAVLKLLPKEATPDVTGTRTGDGGPKGVVPELHPRMIAIPPGSFLMGSPGSEMERDLDERQHQVHITRGFLMSETEVTQEQYQVVMGKETTHAKGVAGLPVSKVSWFDAAEYCNRLSRLEHVEECYTVSGTAVGWPSGLDCAGYRLPTEAEWEYAARAGQPWLLSGSNHPEEIGWYAANAEELQPVKSRKPNARGLYDMSGNLWEWVWDWYDETYPDGPLTDPLGPRLGSARINRGGSWIDDSRHLRVADRSRNEPGARLIILGFRVARTMP